MRLDDDEYDEYDDTEYEEQTSVQYDKCERCTRLCDHVVCDVSHDKREI